MLDGVNELTFPTVSLTHAYTVFVPVPLLNVYEEGAADCHPGSPDEGCNDDSLTQYPAIPILSNAVRENVIFGSVDGDRLVSVNDDTAGAETSIV